MTVEMFKPKPIATQLRNCGNCLHCYEERMPQQLVSSLVCHRFPPQVVAVPAPAAPASPIQTRDQQNGVRMQFMSMFPIVQAGTFCHSHTPRPTDGAPVAVEEPDITSDKNG